MTQSPTGPALLVAVSGIDGAGKSTTAANVAARLVAGGPRVEVLKVPLFSNPAHQRFGRALQTVEDRSVAEHRRLRGALITLEAVRFVTEDVAEALTHHDVVICDRYIESIRCYFEARELDLAMFDTVTRGLRSPDVHIHLDVPLEAAMARLVELGEDPEPKYGFMARMHVLLSDQAKRTGAKVIDGTLPAENVTAAVCETIALQLWGREDVRLQ